MENYKLNGRGIMDVAEKSVYQASLVRNTSKFWDLSQSFDIRSDVIKL